MEKLSHLLHLLPDEFLAIAGIVAVGLITALVVLSFREGREISFWPPRLGPRPDSSKKSQPSSSDERIDGDSITPRPRTERRLSSKSRMTRSDVIFERVELDCLKQIRVIERTDHSIIQTCLYNDTNVVVKRTREDLCDLDALSILIHAARDPLEGWSRSVRAVIGGASDSMDSGRFSMGTLRFLRRGMPWRACAPKSKDSERFVPEILHGIACQCLVLS